MAYSVESTQELRNNLIECIEPKLKPESLMWVRRFFAKVYKEMLVDGNEQLSVRSYPMFQNMKRFIEEFMEEETASNILCSLYICGIQLGILTLGDEVESLSDFKDGIDMDDWNLCAESDLLAVDLVTQNRIVNKAFGMEDAGSICIAGLNTLNFLYYVKGVVE